MLPMTIKQQESSKIMAVMQPEIKAIQNKYKGKTDNESAMKMRAETSAVYEKYGTNMTGGCLPLFSTGAALCKTAYHEYSFPS